MCEVYWGDADPNRCSSSTTRKARKQHKCSVCARTIEPGERYLYTGIIDYDGFAHSEKVCSRCEGAIADYRKQHGGAWNADYMPEAFQECLDEEPESAEWIGRHFVLEVDPDTVAPPGEDPDDYGPKRYTIKFDRPKPQLVAGDER